MPDLPKFNPRNGQWCKFHVVEETLADVMRKAGCFETPDGYFLSIWRGPGADPITQLSYPGKLMCVDDKGDNVMVFARSTQQLYNISYNLTDEILMDLHPMVKKEHYPPRYVGMTDTDPRA
jgi:hypothetical protein